MSASVNRFEIGSGVHMTQIRDPRFKTNRLSFNFILPLEAKTVSANAILPFLIRKGYRGCSDYIELNRKLNSLYGANLYTDVLKSGDFQILNVSISSIDDAFSLENEPVSAQAADILCSLVSEPVFLEEGFDLAQFELEKQLLIDSIEAELNEKTSYAVKRMIEHMCADEPYGIHKYGTIDSIRELTLSDAEAAYRDVLKKARVEVYSVGCGDVNGVADRIRMLFDSIERKPITSVDSMRILSADKVDTVEECYNVNQAKLVMGFRTASDTSEEINAARMMSMLFGGTPRSKLFLNVREKLSLCYYCSSRFERNKAVMYVNSGVEFENVDKAKEEILRQLDEIKAGHFTEEELAETKLMVVDSFKTVNDSPSSMEVWYLSQLFSGTCNTPEEEAACLEKITAEELSEAAKRVTLDTVYVLRGEEKK